jgi:2,3-bisphosphoglycerate-dependent phosphoglycerate mutase
MQKTALSDTHSQDKIDEAVSLLSYKKVDPLPKEEVEGFPVMYIFRHGQSEDNAEYVFSGWRDSKLTQKGIEQAEILAEKIKDKKIDMLISSPQNRAVETMKTAISKNGQAKNLEIHLDDRIKERRYGDLQGTSKLEIQLKDPDLLKKIRRSYDYTPPNGESLEMVCKRVADFCDEIIPLMREHKINVAVSCHGNSIRGFRKYFENLDEKTTAEMETPLAQDYAAYTIR